MQLLDYRGYRLAVTWEIPWYAVRIDPVGADRPALALEKQTHWAPTIQEAVAEAKARIDAALAPKADHKTLSWDGAGLLELVSRLPKPAMFASWRKPASP